MNRQERIEGIAQAITDAAMDNPATIATIWTDTVNADGAGISGDEVVSFLRGPGTKVRRGLALLRLIEERIATAAHEHALQQAEDAVSEESKQRHHTAARGEGREEAEDLG